jgi:uracil-DNA glycosylase
MIEPRAPVPRPMRRRAPIATGTTAVTPRPAATLAELRERARHCRDCPLWQHATQTVFGEGDAHAGVMLVGEQPGDREDLAGHPFVGPAGALLDRALAQAGIERDHVYVTNAVKHFKFELRGKRRMHKTPAQKEMAACRQWLEEELRLIRPTFVVALGATAAQVLLGARTPIAANRGQWFDAGGRRIFLTVHPSYLLRIPDTERAAAFAQFVRELQQVAAAMRAARH